MKMAKTFAAGRERENSESFSPARNTKFTHLENEDTTEHLEFAALKSSKRGKMGRGFTRIVSPFRRAFLCLVSFKRMRSVCDMIHGIPAYRLKL